jgi:VWFA-related protein
VALAVAWVAVAGSPGPGLPLGARDVSAQTAPSVFRSGVDLVSVDVCVKTRDGRFAPELTPQDFLILENNTPQRLEFFGADGNVPLAVVLLLDRSASMAGEKLARAQEAARAFIRQLRPIDQVEIITFNDIADRRLALSSDFAAAERAIDGITAQGQTGLFEATLAGLRDLQRARRGRPEADEVREAMLLLTDGEDTCSRPAYDDVLEEVRRSGVIVYGISLRTDSRSRPVAPGHELLQLSHDTGGRAVAVTNPATLTALYEEIAAELRHLYRLGYVPANPTPDGAWRTISVRVSSPELVARSRSGYYAARRPHRLARVPKR